LANIGFIKSELDLKLLVLYIVSHAAEPISLFQLLEIALCDAGVDYFSLTQAVTHMVETGQLELLGERYAITEKGLRNSEICENSLPYSVRMHCDENLIRMNQLLRQEAQIRTSVTENPDGTCTLHLCLNDVTTPMLRMELLAASHTQAEIMAKNFRADPAGLYLHITHLLNKQEAAHD
jgi:hypothetical protein